MEDLGLGLSLLGLALALAGIALAIGQIRDARRVTRVQAELHIAEAVLLTELFGKREEEVIEKVIGEVIALARELGTERSFMFLTALLGDEGLSSAGR
jgi:hypothetical protein